MNICVYVCACVYMYVGRKELTIKMSAIMVPANSRAK